MRVLIFVVSMMLSGQAMAENHWTYGDWTVHVKETQNASSLRRVCTASTGGGDAPWLFVRMRSGEMAPPWNYPTPVFGEYAASGRALRMRAGDSLVFEFSGGDRARVDLETGLLEGTQPFAEARPQHFDIPWMLSAMRADNTLRVYRSGRGVSGREHLYTASLAGFTPAYRKMVELCSQRRVPGTRKTGTDQAA